MELHKWNSRQVLTSTKVYNLPFDNLPWGCNFHFGSCHGSCSLCTLYCSIHLFSSFCVSYWYKLLSYSTDQNVIFVLSLFFGAIWKHGTSISMPPVIQPLSFVFHTIWTLTDTKTAALIILPFTHVGFCSGSINMVFQRTIITVTISKTNGRVGITRTNSAHSSIAPDRAPFARYRWPRFRFSKFYTTKKGSSSE